MNIHSARRLTRAAVLLSVLLMGVLQACATT
jgi:hypothetical protein